MIHFQLVSTKGTRFNGDVYEVVVPAQEGAIALFEDHMPLISACEPGLINVRKKAGDPDEDMESFAVSSGVVQIDGKIARFISDEVTSPEDLTESEAEAAHKLAEQLVSQAGTQVAIHEAHQRLLHARAKLNVTRLHRRRHP